MAIKNFNEALVQFSPYVPKMKLQGTYTSSQTVTIPSGTQYVFALVVGAGGGGSSAGTLAMGAGGGAGGINWGLFPTFGMTSINVTIGAGGTGAANGGINYGGKGGDSSAGAIIAGGGAGGYYGVSAPSNGLYPMSWWGGGVNATGYNLTGSSFYFDNPYQWGFPNAISGYSGTGLGSLFFHTTDNSGTNFDYSPSTFGLISNPFTPLVGNGGGNNKASGTAGVSSVYYSGGAVGSGNTSGGGGAGWTGNGSAGSSGTGGAGGTGGGGGGCGGSGSGGNGGAGYVELYW